MKMYEVLELQNICKSISKSKPPIKIAYKFAKLIKRIEEESNFYQEKIKEIIEEYGVKDENGQYKFSSDGTSVIIIEGKQPECKSKIDELQNLDVKIDNIKFTLDELENLNISIAEIGYLMPFIEE